MKPIKKYLFEDFLKEKIVYVTCRQYWTILLEELFEKNKITNVQPYLKTTYANGIDFFNGNPMVNYMVSETGRAIRIIQEEPNPDDLEITAWLDDFETDDFTANELVISIQLRPKTERVAFELIKKWLVEQYPAKKMERFIDLKIELDKLENLEQEKAFA